MLKMRSHIVRYCRASHTGDAIRVMYSSENVGVVHVLGACAQVQSTVRCSFHTAACNTSFCRMFVLLLNFLLLLLSSSLFLFLLFLQHIVFLHFCGPPKIVT